MKKKTTAKIVSQKMLQPGIYDLWLETELAGEAHAGQFIGVYPKDKSKLLPRPISICQVDTDANRLRLVYRVTSETAGTADISKLVAEDEVQILGILGNGYDVSKLTKEYSDIVLMGGGIGIPPILELAKEIVSQKDDTVSLKVILGYRDSNFFLKEDFEALGVCVEIATEDGSFGTKGNVLSVMSNFEAPDVVCACGPMPMLRAIAGYAKENNAKAYISLEERMACGVGACLGCITKTREIDSHSHVNNARICTDGPVFDAEDLDI